MSPPINAETVLIGILSTIVVVLGSIVVALIAARTNREANAVNFSKMLLDRVGDLEQKVDGMEGKLTTTQAALATSRDALQAAIRFIYKLVDWGRAGGRGEMPAPTEDLHDYLDLGLLRQVDVDLDADRT